MSTCSKAVTGGEMSILDRFKPKEKTTSELQAELRALVDVIVARGYGHSEDWHLYQRLREEIYKRGEKPKTEITCKPITNQ